MNSQVALDEYVAGLDPRFIASLSEEARTELAVAGGFDRRGRALAGRALSRAPGGARAAESGSRCAAREC
jgi:hypothetical protein